MSDERGPSALMTGAEARFFLSAADPCCILDEHGRCLRLNPAFSRLVAVSDPQGGQFAEWLHPDDAERLPAIWNQLRAEGAGLWRLRVRSGAAHRAFEFSFSWDPEGAIVVGMGRESREYARLEESEKLLATLIEALPDAINFKDAQGRWLLANPAMLRVFHLEGVDYYGRRDSELTPDSPFFHECFLYCEQTDEEAWRAPGITRAEEHIPQPDGSELVFESFKVPLFHADGARKGLVVIGRDITHRRRMEEERAKLVVSEEAALAEVRAARELDALKNAFVNSVSHELRTPLTSILGYAEFLIDGIGGPLSDEQTGYALQIEKGAKRLERLIDDLLDFARVEAGTLTLQLRDTSLNAVVEEVVTSFQPQAREARLELATELAEALPSVSCDARRIEQVLINMLGNAVKFTPEGGRITIRTRQEAGTVRCEVRDTGVGIAPEEVPKLFQRFSQTSAGVNKGVGTGLGLSISKSIVEAHGGSLGVESTPGLGSVFWFQLPL